MPSSFEVFEISGPVHLSSINCFLFEKLQIKRQRSVLLTDRKGIKVEYIRSNPHDQRVVVGSLVQATCVLEKDREEQRVGPEALGPAWCQHFNFECIEILKDIHDSSIFGCIFEFKPPFHADLSAPRFVVTFRGTMPDLKHGFRDGLLDLSVIFGGINGSKRAEAAVDSISNLISHSSTQNIWVGGHSLGASIATVTGKYMAKMDIHLKTFLFNPPFASISLDWFSKLDNKFKERLHICKTILKVGVSLLTHNHHVKSHENFIKLASWTPYLFVNPDDPISMSYISYFEKRDEIKVKIIRSIEQVATHTSIREICSDVFGQGSEIPYLLPSATLAVNLKKLSSWYESHGIHQWWQQDITLKFSNYHYQPDTS